MATNVSAIALTEFESNPEGKDAGNEWVELYSGDEINLDGFFLENKDGDAYKLSGTFTGYLVIVFESQWLDNKNESIILRDGSDLLDETPTLNDGDNDQFTWNLCDSKWEFRKQTREESNGCDADPDPEPNQDDDKNKEKPKDPEKEPPKQPKQIEAQQLSNQNEETIILNKRTEKPDSTSDLDKRIWIPISFSLFTIFIIILLALRKL